MYIHTFFPNSVYRMSLRSVTSNARNTDSTHIWGSKYHSLQKKIIVPQKTTDSRAQAGILQDKSGTSYYTRQ
jgi:hypothetical protein